MNFIVDLCTLQGRGYVNRTSFERKVSLAVISSLSRVEKLDPSSAQRNAIESTCDDNLCDWHL